jgi:hypothetical protein
MCKDICNKQKAEYVSLVPPPPWETERNDLFRDMEHWRSHYEAAMFMLKQIEKEFAEYRKKYPPIPSAIDGKQIIEKGE